MIRGRYVSAAALLSVLAVSAAPATAQQTVTITRDQVGSGGGGFVQGLPPPRDLGPAPTGTAKIRGRLTDATTGTAIRRAMIRLSGMGVRVQRTTLSDGNGRFEFADLPAGQYMLNSSKSGYVDVGYGQLAPMEPGKPIVVADKQTVDNLHLSMPRGAVITGRVLDEFGEPLADVQVMAMRMQFVNGRRQPMPIGRPDQTNDIGEFRLFGLPPGQFTVAATYQQRNIVSMDGIVNSPNDRFGYAQTFYPSTANQAEAQSITVAATQHVSDLAIMLVSTRTALVSGVALDASGTPLRQGMVMAMPSGGMGFGGGGSGQLRPDGTFTVSGLAPGSYTLRAMPMNQGPGMMSEASLANVEVNGTDITGVVLAPIRPVTLEGRVIVGTAASALRTPSLRIMAQPAPTADRMMMMGMGPMQQPQPVRDDLTFSLTSPPGPIVIRANGLPSGWMVRAIRLNGRDVTDGLTLSDSERGELEVELSDRAPSLSGTVVNSRGVVPAEFSVVAFPQDQERWTMFGPGRFAMIRGTDGGQFTMRNLLPGDYYIVAVERLLTGQWTDPEFLERIRPSATRLTLQEGETKSIDLRLPESR